MPKEAAFLTALKLFDDYVFPFESGEPHPEGYRETLADCQALAVNLLQKALNGEDVRRCWDCTSWVGRCLKGKPNRIARFEACEQFSQKEVKKDDAATSLSGFSKGYRAWGDLTFEAKTEWGGVFPGGKVPILPIATQSIRFDSFKDPESVFAIDWSALEDWQREVLYKKLGQGKLAGFCLGRQSFCLLGIKDNIFWRREFDDQV